MPALLRIVEHVDEFEKLHSQWDDLEATSPAGTLFLSWSWLMAAWKTALSGSAPIVVVVERDGVLVAGGAFVRRRVMYYGVPVRELSFLGDGISDRQAFLCLPGEERALDCIWGYLKANPFRVDSVRLEQVPADDPTLHSGCSVVGRLEVELACQLAILQLDETWNEYLTSRPSNIRRDFRATERQLSKAGPWAVRHVDGGEASSYLPVLRQIETSGYKADAGKAFFLGTNNEYFLKTHLSLTSPDDVVLTLLELDGAIVAYSLGLIHRQEYYWYNTSYREDLRRLGPGKYLGLRCVNWAYDRKLSHFYMGSSTELKLRIGGTLSPNMRAVYLYPGWKGAALRAAVFRVRPALKRVASRYLESRSNVRIVGSMRKIEKK